MGTVAGGLASAFGGAGEAALKYGEAQRNRQLAMWSQRQSALEKMISDATLSAVTPERRGDLMALRSKVLNLKPGQDPSKILQDVQDHLTIHPVAANAMQPPQQPAPPPGPAAPGQTPGLLGLMNAAAQPATSPVQPSSQQSPPQPGSGQGVASQGASIGDLGVQPQGDHLPSLGPQVSQPPSIGLGGLMQPLDASGGSSMAQPKPADASPVGGSPLAAPQQSTPQPHAAQPSGVSVGPGTSNLNPAMAMYYRALQMGDMPPALQQAAQPFLANEAALAHTKDMDGYLLNTLGPQRLEAIKKQTPQWNALPPYIQAGYAAATMGIPAITMPGMAMLPKLISTRTPGANAPQDAVEYGTNNPIDRISGEYRVMQIPFSNEMIWMPEVPQTVVTDTAGGGKQISQKSTGGKLADVQGAVQAPFVRPQVVNTANGPVWQSPLNAAAGGSPIATGGMLPAGYFGMTPTRGGQNEVFNKANPSAAPTVIPGSAASAVLQKPPQTLMIDPSSNNVLLVRPGTHVPEGAQTPAGVNALNTPTAASRTMAEMAGSVKQEIPRITAEVKALKDKIGPGAGRWNDLWVNKAGLDDPQFAKLDQDLDLLASAVVRTHFGARGGMAYQQALKKNFGEAQSPEDLIARIGSAEDWINTYAGMKRTTPGSLTPAPGTVRKYNPTTGKLE